MQGRFKSTFLKIIYHEKEVPDVLFNRDSLMLLIEDARRELNNSAKYRSLTDPEIVGMSQRLDALLNEYYLIPTSYSMAS